METALLWGNLIENSVSLVAVNSNSISDFNRRLLSAAGVALLVSLVSGPFVIRWLKQRFRERIASDSARLNELHASKQSTPTMGGLLIVLAALAGIGTQLPLSSPFLWLAAMATGSLMLVGACDDWIKQRTQRMGLSVRQKLCSQIVIAGLTATGLFLLRQAAETPSAPAVLRMPLVSGWLFIPWATFIIVGTSNAVNLTDGLDGLAAGCTLITGTALTLIIAAYCMSQASSELDQQSAICCSALSGSALGFLWFNRHPAKVFMGDAGSLPIGGLLAVSVLASGFEFALLVTGAVFVVETLSVFLQVVWYRRTKQRILLCSPLHNHFVFRGTNEIRIVMGFWTAALIMSMIGVLLWS